MQWSIRNVERVSHLCAVRFHTAATGRKHKINKKIKIGKLGGVMAIV